MGLVVDNASRPMQHIGPHDTHSYLARSGDTVQSVSRQHGVDPEAVMAANPQIRDASLPLRHGEMLQIPQDDDSRLETHTLQPGETMADVAEVHGVPLQELLTLNGFDHSDLVYPGTELLLPTAAWRCDACPIEPPAPAANDDVQIELLQQAADIRADALAAVGVPVEDWTAAEAAQYTARLNEAIAAQGGGAALADAVIVVSEAELQRSAELLGNATENKDDAEDHVKALTDNISVLGNTASDEIGTVLAMTVAEQIPEDSEQNWVDDGFGEFVDRTNNPRFIEMLGAALYSQGKTDAGDEMLHTSAGGVFGHGGVFDDVANEIRDFPGDVWAFARDRVLDPAGDWLRDRITDVLQVEERIGELSAPGDSIFIGADIAGSLVGLELSAAAGVRITMLEGGRYRLEVFGEGAAGLAGKVELPGFPELDVGAQSEAGVSVSFEFDSKAEVTQAADALTGMTVGIALQGTPAAPIGGVLIAATADEFGFIGEAYAGVSIELSQSLQASAEGGDLADMLGVPDAQIAGLVGSSVRLDIPRDGSPQLVYSHSVALEGEVQLTDPLAVPGGGPLVSGSLQGSASLQIETTIPIEVDLDRLFDDPAGVVLDAVGNAAGGATTTVNGVVNLQEGVDVDAPVVDEVYSRSEGVQIQFSAEAGTVDMFQAVAQAASGNLLGGLSTLGSDASVDFTLRRYEETTLGVGDPAEFVDGNADTEAEGLDFSFIAGSVEITAGYAQRNSEIVWEGTAGELEAEFGDLLDDATFGAS